jgi:ABC-2 type transport system ATP-binding protein
MDSWRQSPSIKRQVGYLPGDVRLYPWITGNTALRIIGRVRGMDLRGSGADLASRFQLEMDLRVRKMSRGMRQKLGLILALVHRPQLLILDEPTSGLDPIMQQVLADYLRELARDGHTVFFSSHTLSEVESLCDRVAIVRQGRIVADQSLAVLRDRAERSVTLTFADVTNAQQIQLPDFLQLDRRDGRQCHCRLQGPAPPLIQWASQQPLVDLEISPPDLESLFRRYYDSTEPSS